MKHYQACLRIGACCGLLCGVSACNDESGYADFIPSYDGSAPTALIQGRDGNFYGTTWSGGQFGSGTVFRVTPGGTETILYSFGGSATDGANPQSLVQGGDGNFYGATAGGGTGQCQFGCGTAFKVTPGGVETVLYSFSGGSDGGQPNGLIQGSDGNFYGTTAFGGVTNSACGGGGCGVVFRLTPAGAQTVLYSFTGSADGASPVSLIQGTDGNFYGMTNLGGASSNGTVFKITPGGVESVLHAFSGGSDGQSPQVALTEGSDGNFYGTTPAGGASSSGVVFKITPAGVETVLHAFAAGAGDGGNPGTAMVQGRDGNFYGTTNSGGNGGCFGGCGTVFKVAPGGAESLLYLFTANASSGQAPGPSSLLQGSDGNFYGTTSNDGASLSGTLFRLTSGGVETILYTFGTNPGP